MAVERFIPPRNLQGAVYQAFLALSKYLSANITTPPAATPVGTIVMYGGSLIPAGWIICQGQAVSRTDYAALFSAVGATWGPGDGSTTFNLPDLRGRAPIGAGTGSGLTARALGGTGGAETHLLTTGEMPVHNHPQNVTDGTGGPAVRNDYNAPDDTGNTYPQGISTGDTGGSTPHNNMQPWAGVNFIIKAT